MKNHPHNKQKCWAAKSALTADARAIAPAAAAKAKTKDPRNGPQQQV